MVQTTISIHFYYDTMNFLGQVWPDIQYPLEFNIPNTFPHNFLFPSNRLTEKRSNISGYLSTKGIEHSCSEYTSNSNQDQPIAQKRILPSPNTSKSKFSHHNYNYNYNQTKTIRSHQSLSKSQEPNTPRHLSTPLRFIPKPDSAAVSWNFTNKIEGTLEAVSTTKSEMSSPAVNLKGSSSKNTSSLPNSGFDTADYSSLLYSKNNSPVGRAAARSWILSVS